MMKYDILAAGHMVRFTRPSSSVFAYCKQSKTGAEEGLGTRVVLTTGSCNFKLTQLPAIIMHEVTQALAESAGFM